jgi:putative pyruvate formate lyase activating enzyme
VSAHRPGYLALHDSGELAQRAARMRELLDPCTLCPRRCGVHRLAGEVGICGAGAQAAVAQACHHRGEEPSISGSRGSGTIFFAGCNLHCVYCQNHQISLCIDPSTAQGARSLADTMLSLQDRGVHNINLVTPSHVVPQILAALDLAAGRGLHLPLVYNTAAYERLAVIRELRGVVDVYLPDLKYGDDRPAVRLSMPLALPLATDYVAYSQRAVREMARQVGRLRVDDEGVAWRGLIVRHLVLPDDLAATGSVLRFIAEELGPDTAISLMAQYRPPPELALPPSLARPLRPAEYERATALLEELGLQEGWVQALVATETYVPDFHAPAHPFER